jgi:para-nitrobenzyl esterase
MRARVSALFLAAAACSNTTTPLETPDAAAPSEDAGASDAGMPPGCVPPDLNEPGVVKTQASTIRGVARGSTYAYLGVRYAAPPIETLRFAPPQPPPCEPELRETTTFGSECPQLDRQGQYIGDEDCLFLNIWAPQNPPPEPRPVLFFIHGGGHNQGSSSALAGAIPLYDGEELASRGNVVVTINYRLGALGFAAHPLLDAISASGNYGLRDQIAALEWVRDEIASFGGDPQKVMIFGESAGGVDVCALYASPSARGLFARAIMQSGGCVAAPKTFAVDSTDRLLIAAGCDQTTDQVACLREKTPAELIAALPPEVTGLAAADFGPIVDGEILTEAPLLTLSRGSGANVPFIIGTNAHETALMLPQNIMTPEAFETAARAFLAGTGVPANKIDPILAIYPAADYASPRAALIALTTDWRWSCPGRTYLRALGSAPRHRYYFTQSLDPMRAPMLSRAGAYHGLELFYIFGAVDGAGGYMPTAADLSLSDAMQRYWTRFAASGDPNGSEDPAWPAYDNTTDAHLIFGTPISESAGVRTAQCDALEAILR